MITTMKAHEVKHKLDRLDLIKIQNFTLQETPSRKRKTNCRLKENICKPYLIKDLYPESIKNLQCSKINKPI